MGAPDSVFLDFRLPTATTWFYFSVLLAVALFFKFSRLLSIRNLDLVGLFLPAPGLLLLLGSGGENRWGFVWLLAVSGWLLLRCLADLALVRRPALAPNLSPGGLAWLAGTLFASLVVVAVKEPTDPRPADPKSPPVPDRVQRETEKLVEQQAVPDDRARLWVRRTLAVLCHLAVVAGLVVVGWRHFQDTHAGVAMATFYLLMPYTYLLLPQATPLPGQWHHVWPAALLVWAVAAYRRPSAAGLLLGLAAGSLYFPALLFPLWLSFYRGRGGGRFAAAFVLGVLLCLGWLAVLAWVSGELPHNFAAVLPMPARDWLPWLQPAPGTPGLWRGVHWAYRMPVFLAYLTLVLVTAFWPAPKNLAHVLALSAALLLGTQFWYADQGGVYVLWYVPLLLLLAFRPNLTACEPPPIAPESDWLHRARRSLGRLRAWLFRLPEPPVKVQ